MVRSPGDPDKGQPTTVIYQHKHRSQSGRFVKCRIVGCKIPDGAPAPVLSFPTAPPEPPPLVTAAPLPCAGGHAPWTIRVSTRDGLLELFDHLIEHYGVLSPKWMLRTYGVGACALVAHECDRLCEREGLRNRHNGRDYTMFRWFKGALNAWAKAHARGEDEQLGVIAALDDPVDEPSPPDNLFEFNPTPPQRGPAA